MRSRSLAIAVLISGLLLGGGRASADAGATERLADTVLTLALLVREVPEAYRALEGEPRSPLAQMVLPVARQLETASQGTLQAFAFADTRCKVHPGAGERCRIPVTSESGAVFALPRAADVILVVSSMSPQRTQVMSVTPTGPARLLYDSFSLQACETMPLDFPLRFVHEVRADSDSELDLFEGTIRAGALEPELRKVRLALSDRSCTLDVVPECPVGTRRDVWDEMMLGVAGKATGCVSGDGMRVGPVVALDEHGQSVLAGAYHNGRRDGIWSIQGKSSWVDAGVVRALDGGELTKRALGREGQATQIVEPQESLPHSLALERLRGGLCKDCASYAIELAESGRVAFTGYAGTPRLGPHCGHLSPEHTSALLRIAQHADLKSLADRYRWPATDGGLNVVRARWIASEKLIDVAGGAPRSLTDLISASDLALPAVSWDCDPK